MTKPNHTARLRRSCPEPLAPFLWPRSVMLQGPIKKNAPGGHTAIGHRARYFGHRKLDQYKRVMNFAVDIELCTVVFGAQGDPLQYQTPSGICFRVL